MGAKAEESDLAVRMVREIAREQGGQRMSDAELSRRSGVPYATLRRLLTEDPRRGPITVRQIDSLCSALGLSPAELMTRALAAASAAEHANTGGAITAQESAEIDDVIKKMRGPHGHTPGESGYDSGTIASGT